MNAHALERLRELVRRFYREAETTDEQDRCCAFLDLVNEACTHSSIELRRCADELWKSDKKGAKALHRQADALAQQKGLDHEG